MFGPDRHCGGKPPARYTSRVTRLERGAQTLEERPSERRRLGRSEIESSARRRLGGERKGRNEEDPGAGRKAVASETTPLVRKDPQGQDSPGGTCQALTTVPTDKAHLDEQTPTDRPKDLVSGRDGRRTHTFDQNDHPATPPNGFSSRAYSPLAPLDTGNVCPCQRLLTNDFDPLTFVPSRA